MRLTRVFVDAPLATGELLSLPPGPAQHLTRVLRLDAGDALTIFNGRGGEYAAGIETVRRGQVSVHVGAHHAIERESPLATTLLQGLARGEKMDQVLQKATELGVTRVVPVMTARSTVKLDAESAPRKQQHWQGVVIGACEQSGRNRIPEVAPPQALAAALAATDAALGWCSRRMKALLPCSHCLQPATPTRWRCWWDPRAAWTRRRSAPPSSRVSSVAASARACCAPKPRHWLRWPRCSFARGDLGAGPRREA